jgi:hypothetical protein
MNKLFEILYFSDQDKKIFNWLAIEIALSTIINIFRIVTDKIFKG